MCRPYKQMQYQDEYQENKVKGEEEEENRNSL